MVAEITCRLRDVNQFDRADTSIGLSLHCFDVCAVNLMPGVIRRTFCLNQHNARCDKRRDAIDMAVGFRLFNIAGQPDDLVATKGFHQFRFDLLEDSVGVTIGVG